MKLIPDGSIDLVLTDPPYGTMKGSKLYDYADGIQWDETLEMKRMWTELNRITRLNGRIVLFSQEPFTNNLLNSVINNITFSYRSIWVKDHFASHLTAKKALVNYYEDILMFTKNDTKTQRSPAAIILEKYVNIYGFEKLVDFMLKDGRFKNRASAITQSRYKFGVSKTGRFDLPNQSLYEHLSKFIDFEESYEELKELHEDYSNQFPVTFNLPKGKKSKSNIFEYKKDYDGYHPTQKPVALLEDLIKVFSNKGNTVLDFTMGSGSTGVAAIKTDRKFIGIEREEKYFDIASARCLVNSNSLICPE